MTPFDPDQLMNAYASVAIPDLVREDIRASYCLDRSTVVKDSAGRTDIAATMVNEGMRVAFLTFLSRIDRARAGKANQQTKAVSDTAEEP